MSICASKAHFSFGMGLSEAKLYKMRHLVGKYMTTSMIK